MVFIKLLISILGVAGIVTHLFFPQVRIDLITLCLGVLALIPWLAPIVKSLEIPGGFKIELQDVQRATRRAESAGTVAENQQRPEATRHPSPVASPAPQYPGGLKARIAALENIAIQDPNIALVGLRIEIESFLRNIARGHGLPSEARSARQLLRAIQKERILPSDLAAGVDDLIGLGNQAAHGASVSPEAAKWAIDRSPEILGILTNYLGD